MKIEIEPTEQWATVEGVLCRVWRTTGTTHAEALFFIVGVAVPDKGHPYARDFERELIELFVKVADGLCGDSAANPAMPCNLPREHGGWHRHGEALSWPRAEREQ